MSNDETETTKNLLAGNPEDWESNYNMREWVREALEAKGAECTGAGFGACQSDLDIEFEGMRYNIRIQPRPIKEPA